MTCVKRPLTALCFLLCACNEEQKVVPYTGNSAHWRQASVPVSLQCAACHTRQFEEWAGSDHAWAYRTTDPALDSEPFHGQQLSAHSSELTFSTSKEGQLLMSDGESGRSFRIHSVLGRRPLVQYLVEGRDGGLHTPSAAWDTQRHEWFDMFEADSRLCREGTATRNSGDWGHWLGRGMNWNSQCAWCHTSHFRKNYDPATDRYSSRWTEPGVTCIQCHRVADKPSEDGCMVAKQHRKLTTKQNHDNCATCHARREEFDDKFTVGDSFDDHFRLELPLIPGIFWSNGMQRDEDYCETGLRLSRMGAAGVSCLDCHDPHTATLKLPQEDNSLCMRCHATGTKVGTTASPIIDPITHSPCPPTEKGARCVDCHMPESPYMARDPRRDHSFNSPDAVLSHELGLPNVCATCHGDKDIGWAMEAQKKFWPGKQSACHRARTRAVHHAMEGRGKADDLLRALAQEDVPAWRATILGLLGRMEPTEPILNAARTAAKDKHPMVRAAAVGILGEEALNLTRDPVKLVRRAAAWPLIDRLIANPDSSEVVAEMEAIAQHQSDQPTGAMQLAVLAEARGDMQQAEFQYLRAAKLDPNSCVAYMDYAVFLARQGRSMDALQQMLHATRVAPQNPEAFYRLGLILAEVQQYGYALSALERALELDPTYHRARHNKAMILHHLGRHDDARKELELLHALQHPPISQP